MIHKITLKITFFILFAVFISVLPFPVLALPLSGIETETLLIPAEYYEAEEGSGDIQVWEDMSEEDRRFYISHSVMSALAYFMSDRNSPEREFMVSSGWNGKFALEAYRNLKEAPMFVENTVFRTDLAVAEYLKRCDIVRATILCRSGAEHCCAHKDITGPYTGNAECEICQLPSLWQIAVYQALMELWSSVSLEA